MANLCAENQLNRKGNKSVAVCSDSSGIQVVFTRKVLDLHWQICWMNPSTSKFGL